MDSKAHNPSANVPKQSDDEPRGDRGRGDKTWSPNPGVQGISNRPDDLTRRRDGEGAAQHALSHDEVIEDEVEREENRKVEHDVQQDVEGQARRQSLIKPRPR